MFGAGPYTIFAPTDEAFNRLPGGIQQSLQEDPELLRRTLLYHISPGVREARALHNEIRVETLASDKQLTVRIYADKVRSRSCYQSFSVDSALDNADDGSCRSRP